MRGGLPDQGHRSDGEGMRTGLPQKANDHLQRSPTIETMKHHGLKSLSRLGRGLYNVNKGLSIQTNQAL